MKDKTVRLTVFADTGTQAWTTIEAELLTVASRVDGAVRTANIMEGMELEGVPFHYAFDQTLSAWDEPPISVSETSSLAIKDTSDESSALAHTSPGMMLQFAIAGLLTAAQIIVTERRSRTLQRLLTTATRKLHVLFGHYLAIFLLIFTPVHDLDHFWSVCVEGELFTPTQRDHAGGFLCRAVYFGAGIADRHLC